MRWVSSGVLWFLLIDEDFRNFKYEIIDVLHTMLLGFLLIEEDFTTYEEEGGGEYQGGVFYFLDFIPPLAIKELEYARS